MREAKGQSLFTFQEKREALREKEDEEGLFIFFRENTCTEIERSTGALTQAQKSRGKYGPFNAVRLHLCAQKSRSTAAINAVQFCIYFPAQKSRRLSLYGLH